MTKLREAEAFFNPPSAEVRAPGNVIPAMRVGFKRLTEDAVLPTKAHASDSGFDLVASADIIVEPGATVVVPTGIAVQLPAGFEATVRPRSGVTSKTKMRVQLGTIDNGYGGEIGVIVDNVHSGHYPNGAVHRYGFNLDGTRSRDTQKYGAYVIHKGDKLAQLVITRLPAVEATEVFDVGESDRGTHGFGSSGVTSE